MEMLNKYYIIDMLYIILSWMAIQACLSFLMNLKKYNKFV